jgi:hypothetical protein
MRTAIAVFLSLLFLAPGGLPTDGIELLADLDEDVDEEAAGDDEFNISSRSNRSRRLRSRQARSNLSAKLLGGFHARHAHFLSTDRTETLSDFSQQELYRLQEVYRL